MKELLKDILVPVLGVLIFAWACGLFLLLVAAPFLVLLWVLS